MPNESYEVFNTCRKTMKVSKKIAKVEIQDAKGFGLKWSFNDQGDMSVYMQSLMLR